MNGLIHSSLYFGMLVSVGAYMLGVWLKKKTGWAILNPLLVAIIVVIAFLSVFHIEYKEYNRGAVYLGYFLISIILVIAFLVVFHVDYESYNMSAKYLSYLLTPATVCLAIPLYKQLELLRQHLIAVASAIVAGVAGSVGSIYVMCRFFQLEHTHYVTLLPKSITTAIGMGVSEEAGGIVTLTVISIIITGILGNIIADWLFQIFKIEEPIAKGLALGTAAHAIGTAKALELGEIEGAMSSLSIAVAGLLTVVVVPLMSGLI